MSYPLDVAAQNAALDAMLGDAAASSMPTSFEVAWFNADPRFGGTELTSDGGYARETVPNDSTVFPDAVDGRKDSAVITWPLPTAAWSDTGAFWGMYDAADHTTLYFIGRPSEPVDIDGTETAGPAASLGIYWNTEGL